MPNQIVPESPLLASLRAFRRVDAFTRAAVEVAAAQLPERRLRALRDEFLAADADGDGSLSLAEFRAALESPDVATEEVRALFDAADVDASEAIGFHEFCAAALARRVDLDDAALRAAFDAIDSEGLGYLSPEAVRATIGLDHGAAEGVGAALEHADADGDGRVDYGEFLDHVRSARLAALAPPEAPEAH